MQTYTEFVAGHDDDNTLAVGRATVIDDREVNNTFRATTMHDTVVVCDDASNGVWWPSADALAEIEADADPMARAVAMAHDEPMRGEWKQ